MAAANEVTKNIDALVARLGMAEQQAQKLLAVLERVGNVQYGAPNVGTGAPSYVSQGGTPGNTTQGVAASATSPGAAASTPAAQAAQAQVRLSGPQQGIANQILGAGLTGRDLNEAWGKAGLPGAPPPPAAPAMSPNSVSVGLIQSAQSGFGPFPHYDPGGMSGMYTRGTGAGNLYAGAAPFMNAQRMQLMGGAAGYGAIQGFGLSADATVSGRVSPTGIGAGIGGTVGMLAGGFAGSIVPGLGTMVGAAGGAALGGAIGGYLGSPIERAYQISASFTPGVGLTGNAYGQGMVNLGNWAKDVAEGVSAPYGKALRQNVSAQSVGAGYSTMVAALLGSSIDPGMTIPGTASPGSPGSPGYQTPPHIRARINRGGAGGAIEAMIDASMRAASPGTPGRPGYSDETLPQAISSRLHTFYPNDEAAQAAIKAVAPIWHSVPFHQSNPADIIARHGTTAFLQYQQSTPDSMKGPQLTAAAASGFEAILQSSQRGIEMAALQTRGSGLASAAAYIERMSAAAGLPGGEGSMAYAQARAGYRSAIITGFEQGQTTRFDIPLVQQSAELARARVMPYRPGEVVGRELTIARSQFAQAGEINNFITRQKAVGMLSEDEELSLRSRSAALSSTAWNAVSRAAEGGVDWVGSISVNRVSGFRRFNQGQMAARFGNAYAPFRRDFGFSSGGAEQNNNDFWDSFGVPTGPYSRSAGVNAGAGSDRLASAMERLAAAMEKSLNGGRGGSAIAPDGGRYRMSGDVGVN
jgi:hypothetical protein